MDNDSSKGSQTDRNTQKGNEVENATFETIAPEKDNPVRMEFEIGNLGNQELKEMKLPEIKQVMIHWAIVNLPSENFNVLILKKNKKGTGRFAGIFLLC